MLLSTALTVLLSSPVAGASGPNIDQPLKTGASAPRDAAVVIGVEDYLRVPDVPYATRDARSFYDFAVYTRGIPAARVRLLDSGANREQILSAVETAGKEVSAGGTVWVYFAGHGAADASTGERLLLGDDVRQDPVAFSSRGVPVSEIKALAGSGGGSVNLLIDACYGGIGRSGQELVAGKRFLVPAYVTEPGTKVFEWNASGADQLSGPLDKVRHGAFTYFAIGALRGWADGQVDGHRDGRVTGEEAHLYVRDALRAAQIVDQQPQLSVADPSSWVLSSGTNLEQAPSITPSLGVAAGAANDSRVTRPTVSSSTPLALGDRDFVDAWVDGVVAGCEERHPQDKGMLYVAFRVKPGPKLKGVNITIPPEPGDGEAESGEPTTFSPTQYAMFTCVRERIRSQTFESPGDSVAFKRWVSIGKQPEPQGAPITIVTGPTTIAGSSVSSPVPSSASASAGTVTMGAQVSESGATVAGSGVNMGVQVDEAGATGSGPGTTMGAQVSESGATVTGPGVDMRVDVTEEGTSVTGPGVNMSISINGVPSDAMGVPAPVAPVEPAPVPVAQGPVKLTFRSLDDEWVDVRVDGKVLAEIRNEDEVTVTVAPGLHTVEFLPFMDATPFASGRLDTAGATQAIVFGVDKSAGVTVYNHDGWR